MKYLFTSFPNIVIFVSVLNKGDNILLKIYWLIKLVFIKSCIVDKFESDLIVCELWIKYQVLRLQ